MNHNENKRNIQITVKNDGNSTEYQYDGIESLMDAMLHQGIYISAYCGGRGTCGKCKIQVLEGNLEITSSDKLKLTEKELQQGYRLACKAYPKEKCTIRLAVGDEKNFEVVTENNQNFADNASIMEEDCGIAIDIGTTTIAISLVGLLSKSVLRTYTTINRQRIYGADVISRIKASEEGKKEELQESIRANLLEGIQCVVEESKISKERVLKIAIAGNTTMGHLLMGYSCKSLGVYPFIPVNISTIIQSFEEILGSDYLKSPVILLPGISTFVGGDIVAGLLDSEFDKKEKPCLLIDLGTNGEMAIGNKDKILVSSTAAGPAFEGGNISCGVGSIPGAICNVSIEKGNVKFTTIGGEKPAGLCGTGVIEMTSELLKDEIIDETGLLLDEFFDQGYPITKVSNSDDSIIFTQKDVREIQLAKSAIRAGTETLLKHYGITYEEVDTVYLAGGFGYKMNLEKAIHIGLLPKELSGRIKAVGNSSLGGAIQYLVEEKATERIEKILQVSNEIHLSNDKDFNELYIEYMFF